MLTGGLVNVEFILLCPLRSRHHLAHYIDDFGGKHFLLIRNEILSSRNEHSSLTSWIIIGVPLAGLLKRSENLGINRIIRRFVTFLFISVVVSAEYSMFADSRRGVIVIKAFFSKA